LKRSVRKLFIPLATALLFWGISNAHPVAAAGGRAFATSANAADVSALLEVAEHQFGAGNYSSAIATLRSIVAQNPTSAEAFYWLGRCYFETHDLENAISHGAKAVALEPTNSVFQQWLGRSYGAKAGHDKSFFAARKAKKQFEQAVELDPSNVDARRDLEEFCLEAPWIVGGSSEEARAQADAIASVSPEQGHIAHGMYDEKALKKPDLAENEYRQVLSAKPRNMDDYFDVAGFFQRRNKPADMNAALDAAAQVNPNDPRLMIFRAEAMVLSGTDLKRAEEYLKSYLASTPDRSDWPPHAAAREWLGRLYEAQGKRTEAAEQYRASLELDPSRKGAMERLASLEKFSR
jgi:tetratricopeptide (TPR) repeat protein